MTANLLKGLNPVSELMPRIANSVNSSNTSDFSSILSNAGRQAEDKGQELTPHKVEADNADTMKSDQETDSVAKPNKPAGDTGKVRHKDTDVDTKPTEIDEEAAEEIAGIAAQMVVTIAEVLDTTPEQVEAALDELSLDTVEVLNADNIPEIVVELTDADSVMDIMADENLYADVFELKTEAEDLMDQLSQELEIPVEDLKQQIKDIGAEEPVIASAVLKEPEEEKAPEVLKSTDTLVDETIGDTFKAQPESVRPEPDQKQTKDNGSSNNQESAGHYAPTVTDQIKEAFVDRLDDAPVHYSTSPEEIMNQVTESLKLTLKEEMTEMEMQLHPASLGNVKVQIASREGVITANFTTQNEQVKAALETQIVELKEQMNAQGLKVAAVEVTVNSHAFERNLNEEGERRNGESSEPKKRNRRTLNLLGDVSTDLEELEDSEQVVADMMARDGNSVVYYA